MKHIKIIALIVMLTFFLSVDSGVAQTIQARLSGFIVLQVEENGEAWYIYPEDLKRYYLGRPQEAFDIMRFLGLGITNADLAKIPTNNDSFTGDLALRQRLSGQIVLQVEENGEAWYIYPENQKRYYLGRPQEAFDIMRFLGLGITNNDLARISIAEGYGDITQETNDEYQRTNVVTSQGSFDVDVVYLDRGAYEMVTRTSYTDCNDDCPAYSLESYVVGSQAFAGIHGSYFCPPDYSPCENETNTFNSPFYDTFRQEMTNNDKLPHHDGGMIVETADNDMYFFDETINFGYSVNEFESEYNETLRAAAANYPSLVVNGQIVVHDEKVDQNQREQKASRGGIGYNNDTYFLVIARGATVIDLAYIMQELGAEYALNLDGGGTTALYYDGSYKAGPGRLLPNAIVFQKK